MDISVCCNMRPFCRTPRPCSQEQRRLLENGHEFLIRLARIVRRENRGRWCRGGLRHLSVFRLTVIREMVMKSLLGATLLAAAILPSTAIAAPATPNAPSTQNVYTSVSHTIIENADGSETVITVYTSYYIFGVR